VEGAPASGVKSFLIIDPIEIRSVVFAGTFNIGGEANGCAAVCLGQVVSGIHTQTQQGVNLSGGQVHITQLDTDIADSDAHFHDSSCAS
jgi:hypothetical protein